MLAPLSQTASPPKCRKAMGSLWTLCPGSALYRQLPTHKEASGNQPGQIWVPEKSPTSTYAHTTPDGTQGGLVSKSLHPAQAGPAAGGHPDALPGGGPGPGTSLHTEQSWVLASPRHPLGRHAPASLGAPPSIPRHRGRCGSPVRGLVHSCDLFARIKALTAVFGLGARVGERMAAAGHLLPKV